MGFKNKILARLGKSLATCALDPCLTMYTVMHLVYVGFLKAFGLNFYHFAIPRMIPVKYDKKLSTKISQTFRQILKSK